MFSFVVLFLATAFPVWAKNTTDAPCEKPAAVAFAKGKSSATYHGGFERNGMDCWTVVARQGQTLTVKVDALEKNASFDIYLPQYQILKTEDGLDVKGKRLTPGGKATGTSRPGRERFRRAVAIWSMSSPSVAM